MNPVLLTKYEDTTFDCDWTASLLQKINQSLFGGMAINTLCPSTCKTDGIDSHTTKENDGWNQRSHERYKKGLEVTEELFNDQETSFFLSQLKPKKRMVCS